MNSEKTGIKDLIERDGRFVGVTSGFSMRPMIKSGRDVVVIEKKKDRLNPLDVALYIRGDSLILHRVLSVTNDGYIMRGDNCYKRVQASRYQRVPTFPNYAFSPFLCPHRFHATK